LSAEQLKGVIEVEFDEGDVVKAAKSTSGAIGTMGKSIEKDLDDIGKSADGAASDLQGMGDKGSRSFDKLEAGADSATASVKDTALEVVALGETFSGVAESAFGFAEKLLSVERAMVGIEQSALGLSRQIEDFETAMKNGELSTRDQQRAVQDIQAVYRDFELQGRELEGQQQALNGEFVSFGLQMLTTITVSGVMLKQLGLTNVALVKQKIALLANSRVLKFLKFDLVAARAAFVTTTGAMGIMTSSTRVATFSVAGLRAGIHATTLALGPIGIAIIAITAAFTIWETNAFGVQEKIAQLWETLKQFIPTLVLLEATTKALFPPEEIKKVGQYGIELGGLDDVAKNVDGQFATLDETTGTYTTTIGTMTTANREAIEVMGTGGIGTMDESLTGAFNSVGEAINETTQALVMHQGLIFSATGNMIDLSKRVGNTNDVYRIWQETLKGVNKELGENSVWLDKVKKKQDELNNSEKQSGIITTPSDFTTTPDGVVRRQPTRRGLVTQEFFNSLPPELKSGFRPTRGPGPAPGTRERLARARSFRNSVAGIIAQALTGRGPLDRTQSGIAQRNQATITSIVTPIRTARAMGLSFYQAASQTVGEFNKSAQSARAAIAAEQQRIFNERVSSFGILSRELRVNARDFVTRSEQESIANFAELVDLDTTQISNLQARQLLAAGSSEQSTRNRRNATAHKLAFLNRQEMIQNLP